MGGCGWLRVANSWQAEAARATAEPAAHRASPPPRPCRLAAAGAAGDAAPARREQRGRWLGAAAGSAGGGRAAAACRRRRAAAAAAPARSWPAIHRQPGGRAGGGTPAAPAGAAAAAGQCSAADGHAERGQAGVGGGEPARMGCQCGTWGPAAHPPAPSRACAACRPACLPCSSCQPRRASGTGRRWSGGATALCSTTMSAPPPSIASSPGEVRWVGGWCVHTTGAARALAPQLGRHVATAALPRLPVRLTPSPACAPHAVWPPPSASAQQGPCRCPS